MSGEQEIIATVVSGVCSEANGEPFATSRNQNHSPAGETRQRRRYTGTLKGGEVSLIQLNAARREW